MKRNGVKDFITPSRKRKISALWNALSVPRRIKVFQLPNNKFFVFKSWRELSPDNRELVFNSVNNIIATAIVVDAVRKFSRDLRHIVGGKL